MSNSLVDIAKRLGETQAAIIDCITSLSGAPLYRMLPAKPINGLVDKFGQKVGRPTVGFAPVGGGAKTSKSLVTNAQEGLFKLLGLNEVEADYVDKDPRGASAYRVEQVQDFLEAMGWALANQTLYGKAKSGDGFDGLLARLPAATADTFVSAGGSSEATSIYGIKMGPNKFMATYNPGKGGEIIETTDYGRYLKDVTQDSETKRLSVYGTEFRGFVGISQYHPKAIGRIGKIDATHKPTAALFTQLFAAMGAKPDVLITTWTGYGYIQELKLNVLKMAAAEKDFDPEVDNYAGIPIIIDPAAVDTESAKV